MVNLESGVNACIAQMVVQGFGCVLEMSALGAAGKVRCIGVYSDGGR